MTVKLNERSFSFMWLGFSFKITPKLFAPDDRYVQNQIIFPNFRSMISNFKILKGQVLNVLLF